MHRASASDFLADPVAMDALTRLCVVGAPWPEIGAAMRMSPRSAQYLAAQEGLDLIRWQARERRRLMIDAAIDRDAGATPATQLAARLGIDEATVRRRRAQLKGQRRGS